jgi:hypothetical protein
MAVQWAQLGDGQVLVASERGAWIQHSGLGGLGMLGALALSEPMPDTQPATEEMTRRLLDGAIAAAERAASSIEEPPLTARRWAWNLVSQWHCAHHSLALWPGVIERFEASGRPDLAQFARQKLEDELDHDRFALDDLEALGYDAEAAVAHIPPAPTVTAALEYARSCVTGEEPAALLGYMYTLERRVLNLDDDWLNALDAVLPAGVDAATGVRVHASDLDIEHVHEAITFFARLPAADRTAIAIGCYRTTQICCDWSPGQIPSDAQLDDWFSRFQVANVASPDAATAMTKEEER